MVKDNHLAIDYGKNIQVNYNNSFSYYFESLFTLLHFISSRAIIYNGSLWQGYNVEDMSLVLLQSKKSLLDNVAKIDPRHKFNLVGYLGGLIAC